MARPVPIPGPWLLFDNKYRMQQSRNIPSHFLDFEKNVKYVLSILVDGFLPSSWTVEVGKVPIEGPTYVAVKHKKERDRQLIS